MEYSRDTPDAVLDSAVQMVSEGEAGRLPDLVYADTPEMRATLDAFGSLLGRLQSFSATLGEFYPTEIERIRAGEGDSISTSAWDWAGQRAREFSGRGGRQRGGGFTGLETQLRSLFADPYAWLAEARDDLTTLSLTDQSSAIMFQNRPVLPPFGLTMRTDEAGDWAVVLPLAIPGVSRFAPKTPQQWQIVGYWCIAAENVLIDLDRQVRAGEHGTLESVAEEAGQMMFPPTAAIGLAYSSSLRQARTAPATAESGASDSSGGD